MDYILFSALMLIRLPWVFLTYDIICQYSVKIEERMRKLPTPLQNDQDFILSVALPVWHGIAHFLECRSKFLVQYKKGTGKNDCEAPERVWARMNPISYATKEMGVGAQHDAIEDFVDYHNFSKNANIGEISLYCNTRLTSRLRVHSFA